MSKLRLFSLAALAFSLALFGCATLQTEAPTAAKKTSYNVRPFWPGGKGPKKGKKSFQKALDTCAVNGGGDVLVPAGTYLIGSIQIGNATTIQLATDSTLQGSPDIDDYAMM